MIATILDLAVLGAITLLCWQGYRKRSLWFEVPVYMWFRLARGHGFWVQFLLFGPAVVIWLLLCHWINTHGWHATAAGGMLIGMTIGLEAMRIAEEQQQWKKEQ